MSTDRRSTTDPILPSDREYLLARRQAILIELGAIERRLGIERTKQPKRDGDRRGGSKA